MLAVVLGVSTSGLAQPRGQLVAALDSDRETLDPHQATGTIDYMVLMHVFDHLIARNPESMKLVGGLAESWRTVDDLTWEFKIRKGVKFQNGEPVNAQAVKFSIDRVLDPAQKSYLRDRFKGITSVQVVDDLTVRLKTEKPNPVLLERLTNLAIVPPAYVKEKGDVFIAKNPVGSGPYRFVEWARGQRLVVEASPTYWGQQPAVKTLVFRPIPEVATAIAEMMAGSVDFIRLVPPDQIPAIEGSGKAYKIPKGTRVLAGTQPAMFDPRVFSDAHDVRTDRAPDLYFTMGYGLHACFGRVVSEQIQLPAIVKAVIGRPGVRRAAGARAGTSLPTAWSPVRTSRTPA
jgi:ABC-type transport system substrate-binding protein